MAVIREKPHARSESGRLGIQETNVFSATLSGLQGCCAVLLTNFCLAGLLFTAQGGTQAKRVDPMLDPEIWGFGGIGGPLPDPSVELPGPISAERWVVVPAGVEMEPLSVLTRWILDPTSPPPTAMGSSTQVDVAAAKWLARAGPDPGESLCAFTVIHSDAQQVRMARLTGAAWMLVNGVPVVGDVERRGFRGAPVALRAGENRIFVAGNGSKFELELWKPATRMVIEAFDIGWPGGDDITYPIYNASLDTTRSLCVHYGHAIRWIKDCKPSLTDWRDGGYIPPLSMQMGASYYYSMRDGVCEIGVGQESRDVFVPICVSAADVELADRRLLRRQPDEEGHLPNNFECVARHSPLPSSLLSLGGVHVFASRGTDEENEVALAAARIDQELRWYHLGDIPLLVSDVDYLQSTHEPEGNWLKARAGEAPLVLRGNADTNAAWSRIMPKDSPFDARRGRVRIHGTEYTGEDLAGWWWSGGSGSGSFVVFDTGVMGERLIEVLSMSWRGQLDETALFRRDEHASAGWVRIPLPQGK